MDFEIIETTDWNNNARIILVQWFNPNGNIFQYSTHLQRKNEKDFILSNGHYFFKKDLAIKDFFLRYIRENLT